MLPAHIVEREDRKTLDLLVYAMKRIPIDRRAWAVSIERSGLGSVDQCVCLFKEGKRWQVAYTERGTWREIATFPHSYEAAKHFWNKFNCPTSPYDFREEWERETGQQFSTVD